MELAPYMETVARRLLGDPTSATRHALRYGRRGSLAVDLRRGVWHDHESGTGGGVLDLIARCTGLMGPDGVQYLRDIGADIPDDPDHRPAPRIEAPVDHDKADRDTRFTAATLAGCRPIPGTIAEAYLLWRGCPLPPADDALFYHPGIRHLSGATVPALVARITDARDATRLIGLHFVALTASGEGKADVAPRKWTRGGMKGGVVRLCPDDEAVLGLGVGEGIETCLSVIHGGWRPVWACLSAGNIAALPPLAPLCLTIFADPGEAGMRGARAAVATWSAAGLEATIAAPPDNFSDWNDGGDHAQG